MSETGENRVKYAGDKREDPCPRTAHPTGGTGIPVSETGENRVKHAGDKREDPVLGQLIQQAGQAYQCLKQEKTGLNMQVTREKTLSWDSSSNRRGRHTSF